MGEVVEIREFQESALDAVVELALRTLAPVYASSRDLLGDSIFYHLKPE